MPTCPTCGDVLEPDTYLPHPWFYCWFCFAYWRAERNGFLSGPFTRLAAAAAR